MQSDMINAFERTDHEEDLGDESRLNLSVEQLRLIPKHLVKDLKPHQELKTLSEEASTHLKVLKDLSTNSEVNAYDLTEGVKEMRARRKVILEEIVAMNLERQMLSEEEDDYSKHLHQEIAEVIGENAGNRKFQCVSLNLIKNKEDDATVSSAVSTGEVPMEVVEENSPSEPTAEILSPEENSAAIEQLKKLKMIAETKRDISREEQEVFTYERRAYLGRVVEKLSETLSMIEELSNNCEDPELTDLLEENKSFIDLQIRVSSQLIQYAGLVEKVKIDQINLEYDVHLYEHRINLFEVLKSLSEEKRKREDDRKTEVTGPKFQSFKQSDSSAEVSLSAGDPAELDLL